MKIANIVANQTAREGTNYELLMKCVSKHINNFTEHVLPNWETTRNEVTRGFHHNAASSWQLFIAILFVGTITTAKTLEMEIRVFLIVLILFSTYLKKTGK